MLRSERENPTELAFLIIQKLVTYMNMEMGSLFITDDSDPEHLSLELVASYAYDRRKFKSLKLEWGEGLPGSRAREKERIFITDVPAGYFEVSSGLGSSRPNCILLVPLKIADRVTGVIELATLRLLRPFEIDFVESLSDRIASSLTAVRNSECSAQLLKQSQAQAEALKKQEAATRENMNLLEQAQKESSRKESEINSILRAIDQSTLVAEFGLNGRFTRINEQFLMLLESHDDQVLGKLYSDFAVVDRSSDEYKAFWNSLKEGKSISNTEMYRLYSGEEIWLQQTFTPIINSEGRVHKILNMAVNITGERTLQQQLKTRELEITRKGLDMQTLKQAVNTSLIKGELDAEGIILEVNDKYCEVTGYGRKELLGRNYRLFLKDSEREQFEKIWQEVRKEKVYEGVIRRSRPGGGEVWIISTFSPVIDESGVIYKIYFMGLDITEKKLKYQLLDDANQEIERLKARLLDYES
ncbi:MAG: PAS domain S-box protein [Bacteroidales bacterium]|nr:PAS domain S-box protein [Bacteroidales bacterium]